MIRTLSRLRREGGISLETLQKKRASARVEGRISGFFLSCRGVSLELQWGPQGPAHGAYGRSGLQDSWDGPLRFPLQSLPGLRSSSPVEAGISGFISRADREFGVPLGHPQGSQASSRVEPCKSARLWNPKSQCQASCRVDCRDQWLSLQVPQGCHSCHRVFSWSSG